MSRNLSLFAGLACAALAASTAAQSTTSAGAAVGMALLEPSRSYDATGTRARSMILSPVDSALYTADEDGLVKRYKSDTGELVRTIRVGPTRVNAIRISGDGKKLVVGSLDGTARLYDADTGAEIARRVHGAEVRAVWTNHDGSRVLSTAGTVAGYWNPGDSTGGYISTWTAHKTEILAAAVTPDGKRAVTGGRDRQVHIWSPDTGQQVAIPFTAHLSEITALAIDMTGSRVLSGDAGAIVCYWSPEDPAMTRTFRDLREPVVALDLAANGTRAVLAGAVRSVLTDPVDNKALAEFSKTAYKNYAIKFNPDATKVLVGRDIDPDSPADKRGTIKVFDLK